MCCCLFVPYKFLYIIFVSVYFGILLLLLYNLLRNLKNIVQSLILFALIRLLVFFLGKNYIYFVFCFFSNIFFINLPYIYHLPTAILMSLIFDEVNNLFLVILLSKWNKLFEYFFGCWILSNHVKYYWSHITKGYFSLPILYIEFVVEQN